MTTAVSTLADFLLARIAEDEAAARYAIYPRTGKTWSTSYHLVVGVRTEVSRSRDERTVADCGALGLGLATYIARHDPARVLAECEAKRRIVEQFTMIKLLDEWHDVGPAEGAYVKMQTVLALLALPYADHPDYREDWRP